MPNFTQKPPNDRKIELSNESCLGLHLFLVKSIEISFHMKKKICGQWHVTAQNLQRTEKNWLSNQVSIIRVVALFSQACLLQSSATAAD